MMINFDYDDLSVTEGQMMLNFDYDDLSVKEGSVDGNIIDI